MRQPMGFAGLAKLQAFRWWFWVVAIVVLTIILRTYRITSPLADWHAWRQVDTASVTREYVRHGIDLWHPRYHDVSNIPSGLDNLEGWRMVEFPVLNALTALILRANPEWPLVPVSRAISILSFVGCLVLWGDVVRRWYGERVAGLTILLMAVLPYSLYFTRIVLPEPFLLLWVAAATWFYLHWVESQEQSTGLVSLRSLWLIATMVSFAVALLVKPMAVFWLPVIGITWVRRSRWVWSELVVSGAALAVSVIPVWWWREWIQQFPSGIPASDWLFNGNGIRLKPAWWRWLFGDRFGRMWFGHWGASILAIGLVAALPTESIRWKRSWWQRWLQLVSWKRAWLAQEGLVWASFIGVISFLVVFATGNVQHDYYQIPLIPLVCLIWARGAVWLVRRTQIWWQAWAMAGALATVLGLGTAFAWYDLKGNFNVNNPAIELAGAAVQRHVPEDSLVIAPYNGDTTLLFATARWGWPIGFSIDEKRALGAEFYITTAKDDEANELQRLYPTVEETAEYLLLDLRQPLATSPAKVKP